MKTSSPFSYFLLAGIFAAVALADVRRQTAHEDLRKQAESRLRAIYERDELRAQRFRADWLPDSSGNTMLEPAPDAKEQVRARYDVAIGQRTVLEASPQEKPARSGNLSPDGKRLLFSEQRNLYVRDQNSDQKIPLTKCAPDGPVSHHHAVWSPDGKWLACVQSDECDPAWVDGSYTLTAGWTWIRDGQAFVVLSERDGWRQAFFGSLSPLSTEEQAAALKELARTRPSSSTRGRRKMGQGSPQNGSCG